MSGTRIGGKHAAETNKKRHGKDFYVKMALKSQKAWEENGRKPRGFAAMSPEKHNIASVKGGKISKKTKYEKQLD